MAAFARLTDPARSRHLTEGYDYDAMVRNFERDAADLIAGNPDVKFDIFLHPIRSCNSWRCGTPRLRP